MGRNFGFECELDSGAAEVAEELVNRDLAGTDYLHYAHCDCEDCEYEPNAPLFRCQTDSTCDGEIISNILSWGSTKAENAFTELGDALREVGAKPGYRAGFHVHVDKTDLSPEQRCNLRKIFYVYQDELAPLAKGWFNNVRSYNYQVRMNDWNTNADPYMNNFDKGSWLSDEPYRETFEFRLWNSTVTPWRMRMNVGISVAMVEAAKAGIKVNRDHSKNPPLERLLDPFMDVSTWANLLKQKSS